MRAILDRTGAAIISTTFGAGYTLILLGRAIYWLRSAWFKRREVLFQAYACGVEAMPVVTIVAIFAGMILTLQTGIELARYGQEAAVGIVVTVSMFREMGPFMTGLILAAAVGSAMAAELGTMKVSEEIDALEVMSINPVRFLVMPRVLALTIMCPVLTIYTDVIGILGGALVANTRLNVPFNLFFQMGSDFLELKDVYTGLVKAVVFGAAISSVSCAQGLRATRGALGVGAATRASVILSFLLIIILGFFLTSLFYGSL